jgi:competence protein ComEC
MIRAIARVLVIGALAASVAAAQTRTSKTLDMYVVDVEGGGAKLYVSPSGETLLVDTGNPGGRDVERIMAVINEAGVKQLDHVLLTHYHVDHIGGLQELAQRIPIRHYIDHGPTVEEREQVAGFQQAYAELSQKGTHTVARPGDKVALAGVEWTIVTSAGQAIKKPLAGGGKPNRACSEFTLREPRDTSRDENGQSVGSAIVYGKFRAIDLGDLLWNNEFDLMCPNNPIGLIDVYITSHHGTDPSGSRALVHGLQPRVAVTQNGTRKGATTQTFDTLQSSPGFEDVWQVHWAYAGGIERNPAGVFIANVDDPAAVAAVLTAPPGAGRAGSPGATASASVPPGQLGAAPAPAPGATATSGPPLDAARDKPQGGGRGGGHTGPAYWIKVSAQADGSFTVTNSRNGFSKTYSPR